MNWLRSHRRSAWICGITLVLPLWLLLDALLGLWAVRQGYQGDIDRLQPRIARLQGLIEYEDQLREAAARVDQQVLGLVYPASADRATVSAALQTNVREMLTDAGLSVSNSQVLPVREQGNFDYISVKLIVAGDLEGLDESLARVANYLPLVLVESLEVSPVRSRRRGSEASTQGITASLQLLSLRAAQ